LPENSGFIGDALEFSDWAAITFGSEVGPRVESLYAPEPMSATNRTILPGGVDYRFLYAAQDAVGDFILHCPTLRAGRMLAAHQSAAAKSSPGLPKKVFAYTFDHAPWMSLNFGDPIPWVFGAYHGAEVGFVFDVKREMHGSELDLAERMARYWTNFAATGDPNRVGQAQTQEAEPPVGVPGRRSVSPSEWGGGAMSGAGSGAAGVCLNGGSGGPCPVVLDVRTQQVRDPHLILTSSSPHPNLILSQEWDAGHISCAHRIPVQDDPILISQVSKAKAALMNHLCLLV
jgi:hypothetical protein